MTDMGVRACSPSILNRRWLLLSLADDHSCYVSQVSRVGRFLTLLSSAFAQLLLQWDWELRIAEDDSQRNLQFLKKVVNKIWSVIVDTDRVLRERYPELRALEPVPKELKYIHAEDLLERYPEMSRKERETALVREEKAVFIIGIGWTLKDGYPHELRAVDYDDWSTPTEGGKYHGL